MKRIVTTPRPNWQQKVEELGFGFHTPDSTYWDESAYYQFSMREVDVLEKATYDLWDMCLEAVQHVIDKNLYRTFRRPDFLLSNLRTARPLSVAVIK